MEVILSKDVEKLGKAGSVVNVKEGFGRNFLIPRGLAVPLSAANLKKLEQEQGRRKLHLEKIKKDCLEQAERISALSLTMTALIKEDDKLYAGIGAQDIANSLKDEGFDIDKGAIILDEPIKSLGIYEVPVKLHPEVVAKLKVWVVKK